MGELFESTVSCVTIFVVWILGSVLAARIAEKKGRRGTTYFLLSILLSPLVGILAAAVATPDRAAAEKQRVSSGDERKCPSCAELVKREAIVCRFCGKDLPPAVAPATASLSAPGAPRFKSKAEYEKWKGMSDARKSGE